MLKPTLSIIDQERSYWNTSSFKVGMLEISFFVCFFFSSSLSARPVRGSQGKNGGKLISIWISGGICFGNFEIGTDSCSGSSSNPKAKSTARFLPVSVGFGSSFSLLGATRSNVSFPGVYVCIRGLISGVSDFICLVSVCGYS